MRSNVDKFGKKSLQRFFLNLSILRLQSPIFEIRKQPKIVNLYQDKTKLMGTSNLLLVDDHPITIDGYVNILSNHDAAIDFTTANSCQEAYLKITERYVSQKAFDAAFLDISLPPYPTK